MIDSPTVYASSVLIKGSVIFGVTEQINVIGFAHTMGHRQTVHSFSYTTINLIQFLIYEVSTANYKTFDNVKMGK